MLLEKDDQVVARDLLRSRTAKPVHRLQERPQVAPVSLHAVAREPLLSGHVVHVAIYGYEQLVHFVSDSVAHDPHRSVLARRAQLFLVAGVDTRRRSSSP